MYCARSMTNLVCRLFGMILSPHLLPPPKCTTPPPCRAKQTIISKLLRIRSKPTPSQYPRKCPQKISAVLKIQFTALVIYRNIKKLHPPKIHTYKIKIQFFVFFLLFKLFFSIFYFSVLFFL